MSFTVVNIFINVYSYFSTICLSDKITKCVFCFFLKTGACRLYKHCFSFCFALIGRAKKKLLHQIRVLETHFPLLRSYMTGSHNNRYV